VRKLATAPFHCNVKLLQCTNACKHACTHAHTHTIWPLPHTNVFKILMFEMTHTGTHTQVHTHTHTHTPSAQFCQNIFKILTPQFHLHLFKNPQQKQDWSFTTFTANAITAATTHSAQCTLASCICQTQAICIQCTWPQTTLIRLLYSGYHHPIHLMLSRITTLLL
jgi:hypothetical protein